MKDIEFKIGTKEEAFWNDIIDRTKKELESLEKMLLFNEAILIMALSKAKQQSERGNKHNGNRKTN